MLAERPPQPSRSRAARALEPLTDASFRRVWIGAVFYALGQWTERIAIGWYVFERTDSAFLTAVATAVQSAPHLLLGPVAGALADRLPRPRILATSAAVKCACVLGIAALVWAEDAPLAIVLAMTALSGAAVTFHLAPLHTLCGDIVGPERRPSAIGLLSTGQRAVAAAGALGAGVLIRAAGPAWGVLLAAAAFGCAAAAYRLAREPAERARTSRGSLFADTVEGLGFVLRVPTVAMLLALAVIAEIFGFAYTSLLPGLADRVLDAGATGLGGLSAAAQVGSVIATLLLAGYADRGRHGWVFIGAIVAFGALLIGLGVSRAYALSLLAVAGVGACAALVDALEWIMLQAHVDDRMRGRALGAWNVAIGFGWIGPLVLGAVGDAVSIPAAFAIAGVVLLSTAAVATLTTPRLRAA